MAPCEPHHSSSARFEGSPKPAHTVAFEDPLLGDDRDILGLSPGNQHAVKGVLVKAGPETGTSMVVGRQPRIVNFNVTAGRVFISFAVLACCTLRPLGPAADVL